MRRRSLIQTAAALPLTGAARAGSAPKVLRTALRTAEVGFDPPRVGDQSSFRILAHIFESPLTYDPLARPVKVVPQTAARLPEPSADFKRWLFTIRPGIFFADDPAFQGRPRELVAADYVYSIKRFFDPQVRTEHLYQWENLKILGLSELRQRALAAKAPFDYDAQVPGLRALDRHRFELVLAEPAPRLPFTFTSPVFAGAVAREVIEAYADDPMAHPVGTGPFRLALWRRGSRIVLERNPRFRAQPFEAEVPEGDASAAAIATRLAGRSAPLLDRIEIDIVLESQPRWLAFLRGEHDLLVLPHEFADLATPGGAVAPFLAKQGVQLRRQVDPSTSHTFFNFDDPVVGGLTPAKVALRRAVALAYDQHAEVREVFRGQALPAQGMIPPLCYGHDPALKSEFGPAQPARANALLDLFGYADRNGDGWREQPDGSPLVLRIAFPPDQRSRQLSELWLKGLKAVRLAVRFEFAPFGELIKRSLAGELMMWGFNWGASSPDGDFFLGLAYGPNAEQSNDARFRLPAYDRLYERQRALPDGPERLALMRDCTRHMLAWLPYMPHHHRIESDLLHRRVQGIVRQPFTNDWWRWTDLDPSPA